MMSIRDPKLVLPLLLFLVILIQGSLIGLTDDEAYYWVLAQKPALGYAYHPPAVAWLIGLSQIFVEWITGPASPVIVRLPAALSIASVLAMSLRWLEETGVARDRLWRSGFALLSLAGLFALSWMMVPDVPLFLGWMIAFLATWRLCYGEARPRTYLWLAVGSALALLSKYSAVLAGVSIAGCLLLWAPAHRRGKGILAATSGMALALLPTLIWNSQHDWGALLYQFRDRHGEAHLSLVRYLRFWAVELFAAGPVLIGFFFWLLLRVPLRMRDQNRVISPGATRAFRFVIAWVVPAAVVFCIQPLWSDFKPHWAFVVWFPTALAFSFVAGSQEFYAIRRWRLLSRSQIGYGLGLGAFVFVSCHVPLGGWVMEGFRGTPGDPRLDVTNDLFGWSELRPWVERQLGPEAASLPVIGSRYQTASQAAFAMGSLQRVTLLPRDLKARDEWPELGVSEGIGPEWPKLKASVLFVADNRYDAGPEFPGARCEKLGRLEKSRFGLPAKWIDVWKCVP